MTYETKRVDLVAKRIKDDGTEETLIIDIKSINTIVEEKIKSYLESYIIRENAERYGVSMTKHNILHDVWKKESFDPDKKYRIETNLKEVIKKKSIIQGNLAKIIGINESTMSDIINGKNNPNLITILKICAVLDISVEGHFWLVEENDDK